MAKPTALAVLVVLALACTAPAVTAPSLPPSPSLSDRLVIEGDGATQIVDAATGRVSAALPGGLLTPSQDLIVRIEPMASGTAIRGVDLDGLPLLKVDLPGTYVLPTAYGAAPSGFSPNGKWLVLVSRDAKESRFAVIDTERSKLAQVVTLGTRFTFDAIHNDGTAMYVIEHPVPGATTYNVRLYDLRRQVLDPGIIFDKAQIAQFDPSVGLMDGTFHVSVSPKSGDWTYGLYMRPNGAPFVHALNVPGRYAQCIVDLAGTWRPSSMFSMALQADGRRLYVVDAAAGAVSVIDGLGQKVTAKATFAGRRPDSAIHAASAAVANDGSRLYATSTRGIAMIYTPDLSFKGWAAEDLAVSSLAVSTDGTRLYALADGAVHVVDPVSGKVLSRLASAPGARAVHVLRSR